MQMEMRKNKPSSSTFRRRRRTWSFHVVVLERTAKKCTKIYNARAQRLFCSWMDGTILLNLYSFGEISIPYELGFSEISPPQSPLPSYLLILNLINLFIIVLIMLVYYSRAFV